MMHMNYLKIGKTFTNLKRKERKSARMINLRENLVKLRKLLKKTAVAVTIVVLLNVTVVLSQLLQWSLHHAVAIIHAATNVVIAQLQSLIQSLLL